MSKNENVDVEPEAPEAPEAPSTQDAEPVAPDEVASEPTPDERLQAYLAEGYRLSDLELTSWSNGSLRSVTPNTN